LLRRRGRRRNLTSKRPSGGSSSRRASLWMEKNIVVKMGYLRLVEREDAQQVVVADSR